MKTTAYPTSDYDLTAHRSTVSRSSAPHSVAPHPIAGLLVRALFQKFDHEPQLREIDRLRALDDRELARMGLKRGGIAASILGNRFGY